MVLGRHVTSIWCALITWEQEREIQMHNAKTPVIFQGRKKKAIPFGYAWKLQVSINRELCGVVV